MFARKRSMIQTTDALFSVFPDLVSASLAGTTLNWQLGRLLGPKSRFLWIGTANLLLIPSISNAEKERKHNFPVKAKIKSILNLKS
jgi:hypothetical protein